MEDSPNSCGISWNTSATIVPTPKAKFCEMAAPKASPSVKLWKESPKMTSTARGLMSHLQAHFRFSLRCPFPDYREGEGKGEGKGKGEGEGR